ncbi:FXYD domain-containing ion transport regulator 4 isoform X2 [Felis catus]|uniref:FXYD domain-containing ion transport regulator 4 isoform X2 n=1 Tax=Felis catus TaxID=9685 RepID=UPI001D199F65|nr:FXYD domain-containing ion transport regulator 4 isoform X2 [Felis catus]
MIWSIKTVPSIMVENANASTIRSTAPYLREPLHSSLQALPVPAEHRTSFVALSAPAPMLFPPPLGPLDDGLSLQSWALQLLSDQDTV